ncbi:MAG: sigma factor-like helix-turn-helix DNA-binding protein [Pseudomonadota bacterium]
MADPAGEAPLASFLEGRERLIGIACRFVESRAVAEEIVQESWLRWRGKEYDAAKARSIFSLIVANLARDWARRRRLEREVLAALGTEERGPCSERAVSAREDLRVVIAVLDRLPGRTVTAFRMRSLDGHSYAEIGRRLGLSRSRAFELVEDALVAMMLALGD